MRTLICLVCLAGVALAADVEQPEIRMHWGLRVPMRDGIELSATVYRPMEQAEPLPVIFTLTPYTADNYHGFGTWFARHGYVFAAVDVRGRGNSAGTFEPFAHDPQDGHDVVAWLAEQPWCDGQVAMWGISYMGTSQWATLKTFPPRLKTIVPAAAAHPGVDFPFFNGIYFPYDMQWLTMTSGRCMNDAIGGDEVGLWIHKFTRLYREHRAFRELDKIAGNTKSAWRKWVAHPTPDAYWNAMVPAPADYARIDVPILTITGHYDADQPGAMAFYRRHMQHGSDAGKEQHYLVIGPWDHGGCVHPKREFKKLTFDEASVIDLNDLHRAWYDWTMKDGDKPAFLKDRVAYYVAGPDAEVWKYAPTLPDVTRATRPLFLHSSDGQANDVFHSGRLAEARPDDQGPDTYVYDPLDTSPAQWEQQPPDTSLIDQTPVLTLDGRGLVYHSAPLAAALEVAGFVRVVLWIELDVPDTDFKLTLHEVRPDGTSIELAYDVLRARYRQSLAEAELVTPGQIERYEFDSFNFFARRLAKGSRLRLVVTSPNSIYWQKNYNSGGVVADETGADARTATVRVYHDAAHPSVLELPLGQ